jgi:imidazolonepropionase-like amidohydrolase
MHRSPHSLAECAMEPLRVLAPAGSRARFALAAFVLVALLLPRLVLGATPRVHAIVGARIVTAPGKVIERGTIVMRDGVIEAVGANVTVPADARIWEGAGLTVSAGMIDAFVAPPAPERTRDRAAARSASQAEGPEGAHHALSTVTPDRRVVEEDALDSKRVEALREAGFTVAHVVPESGILRGQSAALGLGDGTRNARLLKADAAQILSIETARVGYPGSRMGAIAVMRQAFLDAAWYRDAHNAYARNPTGVERPEHNVAWDAMQRMLQGTQPAFIRVDDMLGVLSAVEVGREAGLTPVVMTAGDDYKRVRAIAAAGVSLVVPVRFPEVPDVDDDEDALEVATELLRYWQDAPANAGVLEKNGVRFALTALGLEKAKDFRTAVATAIERGLSADAALAAVTTTPAALLGLGDRLGTIAPGKVANLTVTTGDLFAKGSEVREVWVDGNRYEVQAPARSFAGRWALTWGRERGTLIVAAKRDTTVKLVVGADTLVAHAVDLSDLKLAFETGTGAVLARFEITRDASALRGHRESGAGATRARQELTGIRLPDAPDEEKPSDPPVVAPVVMGQSEPWRMPAPEQPAVVLVRNATIWTAGPGGTLSGADLLVRRGKVAAVGKGLAVPRDAVVIDGTGLHVSPGIIDEHSHAAVLGGVNECTNINTAEVRIQDVINSESIHIYRQLAGGTTIMHMLHGSCNAIGGQCAAIKARWGAAPADLWIADMPPTIKFALGENPKRSNFSIPGMPNRYPTSRGGVEQVYRDAFTAALDYRAASNEYRSKKRRLPPRRDLNAETLLEILDGKRFVHCHSYRQDEILMLMRVAEEFGFRINTFTHILEGYKVADEMAAHGAAGSSFSDWWAYKFEVYDAIPYNGYLMWDRGVLTAFNSDDAELARRLNQEAAKAVKYGGVPPEEAIRFVTLNPAKMLKIDDRVGSLEPDKDADFVIWSTSPLSPAAHVKETWIDGRKYFDRAADLAGRAALEAERGTLIARAKDAKKGGGKRGAGSGGSGFIYLADTDLGGNDCGASGEYAIEDHMQETEAGR